MDNSIYQEDGTRSSGVGRLFAGRTGANAGLNLRRALVAFDLSTIPASATITSVRLELFVDRAGQNSFPNDFMTIHRVTQSWGEGTSDGGGTGAPATTNDVTWTDRFFGGQTWTAPGGDYVGTFSDRRTVGLAGSTAVFSSAAMVTDVVGWLASPSTNHGWIIRGDEATIEASNTNARRFHSKEIGGTPPKLIVEFTQPTSLTVNIASDSISEGAGAGATTATVTRSGDTTNSLIVTLASNDTSEATVPTSITIAAAQTTSSPFDIDAVDDSLVDGTQTVTVTASATGFPDATDTVDVTDDDVPTLTLTIEADSISEGAGPAATTATVSRNTDTTNALVVNLTSSDTGEATVPASVMIGAGQTTSTPFEIDAVDDAIVDGTQTVTITGASTGFTDGTDTIEVTDDEPGPTVMDVGINGLGNTNRSALANLVLQFDQDTTISGAGALRVFNHTIGAAVDVSSATLLNNGTTTVTWNLTGISFPDGNYTAELAAAEAVNAAGKPLTATHTAGFHVLAGDGSGNAQVDLADFILLNNNFNTLGGPVLGPGDLDGNGDVNLSDFILLNNTFNQILFAATVDFGDAPESGSYPTTLANNGARHVLGSDIFLGASVDAEADGQPEAAAAGDDNAGDDEDGVTFSTLQAGMNATITVTANVPGDSPLLNAWIDFNADGDWDDADEQIFVDQPLSSGANGLAVSIPPTAAAGSTFARFRVTSTAGYSYFGLAPNGEVEDYQVTLVAARHSARRVGPAPTSQLWAAAFVAQPEETGQGLPLSQPAAASLWNRVDPSVPEVVDLAVTQVTSTTEPSRGRQREDSRWLDEELVDLVHGLTVEAEPQAPLG